MTIVGLALIGGLAVACFTKAFGIVFLGEPRTAQADDVHEVGDRDEAIDGSFWPSDVWPSASLLPFVLRALAPVIAQVSQISPETASELLAPATGTLTKIVIAFAVLCALIGPGIVSSASLAQRDRRSTRP